MFCGFVGDILSFTHWILVIFVPNGRSSLDLHFDILYVIFDVMWGDGLKFDLVFSDE